MCLSHPLPFMMFERIGCILPTLLFLSATMFIMTIGPAITWEDRSGVCVLDGWEVTSFSESACTVHFTIFRSDIETGAPIHDAMVIHVLSWPHSSPCTCDALLHSTDGNVVTDWMVEHKVSCEAPFRPLSIPCQFAWSFSNMRSLPTYPDIGKHVLLGQQVRTTGNVPMLLLDSDLTDTMRAALITKATVSLHRVRSYLLFIMLIGAGIMMFGA